MKVLAIIPARGGSKGVPGKNIKPIAGKPLIAYSIEAALESTKLDSIYVSSDDDAILNVATQYKDIKIHKRPVEIANDNSPVNETVEAILNSFISDDIDAVMLLQPTSPLRTAKDIDNAIELLKSNQQHACVISVVPMDDVHPARMYKLDENILIPFIAEYEQARRQDIPVAYYRNGSIYLVRKEAFIREKSMMIKPIHPYIMDPEWLVNIDSPRDVLIAEALIPEWQKWLVVK